jgi:hypothetical protein
MKRSPRFNKFCKIIFSLLVILIFFSYGVLAGNYKIFPYFLLQKIKQSLNFNFDDFFKEGTLMETAFVQTLPDNIPLLYPSVKNREELKNYIDEIKIVPSSEFFGIYANINSYTLSQKTNDIVELAYKIKKNEHKAYAYYVSKTISNNLRCAVLIIPGSGENQALAIHDERGYHGTIRSTLSEYCDVFILIKPNHGYRSIHNGKKRLDADNFLYATLLNQGYSYSANYITESLAWLKFIKENYKISGVAGLSQGGGASFIVSLEAEPAFAIISSGFSLYQREITWAGFNQIIIPGLYNYYSQDFLQNVISEQKTEYFFSYSREKDGFVYEQEAESQKSCSFLEKINFLRISCFIHNFGHVFPEEVIGIWLKERIFNFN